MMPSLSFFNRQFTPSWQMIVLTVCVSLFFARLGFWQIGRAHEKQRMLAAQLSLVNQSPNDWNSKKPLPKQYQNIKLRGNFMPNLFLLDNQHHQHQFGYDVITPLNLEGGDVVLVDRGWVKGDLNRRQLPEIHTPKGMIHLSGATYYPGLSSISLGPMIEPKGRYLSIIEHIDTKKLSQTLQKKVYPFIIRLDKKQANGFVRDWAVVSMPPQRHLAYALQWFAMALVILIIFIALNVKKKP